MLPLRVFVVSLLLPAGTLCISSHSPLDLFAYPAYAVKLNPASPISNTSAEAILAAAAGASSSAKNALQDPRNEEEELKNDDLQIQDSNNKLDVLGLHDDAVNGGGAAAAGHEHDQLLKGPIKPYLLRSSGNGQAYLCSVPQHSSPASASASTSHSKYGELVKNSSSAVKAAPATEGEKEERRIKNEQEKKQAFERGLALLEPLKGTCLYITQGWFTYAFCYGSEIRQFHAVKNTSPLGPPLIEDLTQEAYTLGLWSNRLTQDEGLVDVKKARALGSLREILASEDKSEENALEVMNGAKSALRGEEDSIGDERRYLVQRWTGGTMCDKTGVERSIEVQFHCNSQSSDKIFLVRETAICEYVIVIHTPRLCGEPIFVGGSSSAADDAAEKKKKELNVIECRPVVRDELYAQYISAGQDQEQGGPARSLPQGERDQTGPTSAEEQPKPAEQAPVADQPREEIGQQAPAATEAGDASQGQQNTQQNEDNTKPNEKGQPQIEEFVLGSYILAYDLETGKMTVDPDPAEVVRSGLDSRTKSNEGDKQEPEVEMTGKEAEAMEALLAEFRKSLEEMMQNVGGALRNAKEDAATVQDTIKKVQQAYEAAANGPLPAGDSNQGDAAAAPAGDGGKAGQQPAHARKVDPLSRLTRTGAHNHREIAERYLNGQLGLSAGSKKQKKMHREQEEATAIHLHRQREARQQQQKMGTPQFRNLKRAFEQKWDDDESDNASGREGKSGQVDKAKNVPPAHAANNAGFGGHDEL